MSDIDRDEDFKGDPFVACQLKVRMWPFRPVLAFKAGLPHFVWFTHR